MEEDKHGSLDRSAKRNERIEGLVNEINYYKQKEEEGILYEPNF